MALSPTLCRAAHSPRNGAAPREVPVRDELPEEAAGAFRKAGEQTRWAAAWFRRDRQIRTVRFVSMGRFAKWLVSKDVPKAAGAAAERLSARLSVIAVLGMFAAALIPPMAPTGTRANVPVEILRTKQAPIIMHERPAERPTN